MDVQVGSEERSPGDCRIHRRRRDNNRHDESCLYVPEAHTGAARTFPLQRVVSDLHHRYRRHWRSTGGIRSYLRLVDELARPLIPGTYSHNHIRWSAIHHGSCEEYAEAEEPIIDAILTDWSRSCNRGKDWWRHQTIQQRRAPAPLSPSDITPVLSRLLERIVVTDYMYPSFQSPPPNLRFLDQFAFQPTAQTQLLLFISSTHQRHSFKATTMLSCTNWTFPRPSTASVRRSAACSIDKYLQSKIPDNIYNWIDSFFPWPLTLYQF